MQEYLYRSLSDIDEKEIIEHLQARNFLIIKIQNVSLRDKLVEFIKTEIYPLVHDQDKFLK